MWSFRIDSVVIICAFYRNDQWHVKATPVICHIDDGKSTAIIMDFILAKVINFLHQKGGHFAAIETLDALESSENITFVRITDSRFSAGKAMFAKYPELSFVDALTAACMKDPGITEIYSFDSDFDGIGGITRLDQPSF